MLIPWRRFINRRSLMAVSAMLLVAYLLHLRQGGSPDDPDRPVYDLQRLVVDSDCDITRAVCFSSLDALRVGLSLEDSPSALRPFPVRVQVDAPFVTERPRVTLVFSMVGMDMGNLAHRLQQQQDSASWTGKVILPICSSGRRDWMARIEIMTDNAIYQADYLFTLAQ